LLKIKEQELTSGTASNLKASAHQRKQFPESEYNPQTEGKSFQGIHQMED
jgi:hypothetical protein